MNEEPLSKKQTPGRPLGLNFRVLTRVVLPGDLLITSTVVAKGGRGGCGRRETKAENEKHMDLQELIFNDGGLASAISGIPSIRFLKKRWK